MRDMVAKGRNAGTVSAIKKAAEVRRLHMIENYGAISISNPYNKKLLEKKYVK
jgi:hypothetical protein